MIWFRRLQAGLIVATLLLVFLPGTGGVHGAPPDADSEEVTITATPLFLAVDEQVGTSSDDCYRRLTNVYWSLTHAAQPAGAYSVAAKRYGGGMRFQSVAIPAGAVIDVAYLTLTASSDQSGTTVKSRISAEDVDDAPTFADDADAFDTRWDNRTTARVDWDSIGAWTLDTEYTSPSIVTVIQEIIDRVGWESGNDIVIFWDDFADRSTIDAGYPYRISHSYDSDPSKAAQLHVEYSFILPGTPIDFTVDYVSDYEVALSWTKGTNATHTMIRAEWGNCPEDEEDGFEVYYGTGESFTHYIDMEATSEDLCYRAWSYNDYGYSLSYQEGSTGGISMTLIAFVILALGLAVLGLTTKQMPLMMATGMAWIGLGGYELIRMESVTDIHHFFGWLGIVLGLVFISSPAWFNRQPPEPEPESEFEEFEDSYEKFKGGFGGRVRQQVRRQISEDRELKRRALNALRRLGGR